MTCPQSQTSARHGLRGIAPVRSIPRRGCVRGRRTEKQLASHASDGGKFFVVCPCRLFSHPEITLAMLVCAG